MKQLVIVGVDISKSTLDIFIKPSGLFYRVDNNLKGFKELLCQLKTLPVESRPFIVMEHTGRYSLRFESFLSKQAIDFCKISALEIKRSLGVTRGKSDRVDAERIAQYGWLRRESLVADLPLPQNIVQLQELLNMRSKLVRDRSGYISRLKELRCSGCLNESDDLSKIHKQIISSFTKSISQLEEKIKLLVKSDDKLQKDCSLLRSIKGVGWIVACYMICRTRNFTCFANARKFNCYAGIAPFEHESGSSIKFKPRVSHLANKEVKTLLNLAAFTAIQHDPELRTYYQRKVQEGKPKMCCLNNVRAKLVARMFAVIKRGSPYKSLPLAA